jgi:hypothetical protein
VELLAFTFLDILSQASADEPGRRTENVVVITLDGFRWQEFFGSAEDALLDEKMGGVRDLPRLKQLYWRDSAAARPEALLPFLWGTVAKRGQVFGNPKSRRAKETRTLAGRRRLLNDQTPDTHRLNTPIQGTGADGLKLALALLWERRDQVAGAFPVLAVHDEIVVEAGMEQADTAAVWLKTAMVEAMGPMIAPVPVEVEIKIVRSWGGD